MLILHSLKYIEKKKTPVLTLIYLDPKSIDPKKSNILKQLCYELMSQISFCVFLNH